MSNSISHLVLQAKTRQQPYLDLTDQDEITLADLRTAQNKKELEALYLKGLYIRQNRLTLNQDLAQIINELSKNGAREILIFFDKATQNISSAEFKAFLRQYNISINLMIAPLPSINNVNRPISFTSLTYPDSPHSTANGIITYPNREKVALLNDIEANNIILANHLAKQEAVMQNYKFDLEPPAYILSSNDQTAQKRLKQQRPAELELQQEMDMEIDAEIELDLELSLEEETEQDVDIDSEQSNNLLNKDQAIRKLTELIQYSFDEHYIASYTGLGKKNICSKAAYYAYGVISRIFDNPDITKISIQALTKISKNPALFINGLNIENLPEGFAVNKEGAIFLSEIRARAKNKFTFNIDNLRPSISSPFHYTLLPLVTRRHQHLKDIKADSRLNQKLHPAIKYLTERNSALDLPIAQLAEFYNVKRCYSSTKWKAQFPLHTPEQIKSHFAFATCYNLDSLELPHRNVNEFRASLPASLRQYAILINDKIFNTILQQGGKAGLYKFTEILLELDKRNLTESFLKIIESNKYIQDFGYLISEKGLLFFQKLFLEILPVNNNDQTIADPHKLRFFQNILQKTTAHSTDIEGLFSGLDALYSKFHEFLIKQEITDEQQKEVIWSILKDIIIKKIIPKDAIITYINILTKLPYEEYIKVLCESKLKGTHNYQVLFERLMFIIEMAAIRGNLYEQMHYLQNNDSVYPMLEDNITHSRIREFGANITHESCEWNKNISINHSTHQRIDAHILLAETLEDIKSKELFTKAMRFVALIPPHQRASLAHYQQYLASRKAYGNEKKFFSVYSGQDPYAFNQFSTIEQFKVFRLTNYEEEAVLKGSRTIQEIMEAARTHPNEQYRFSDENCSNDGIIFDNINLIRGFTTKQSTQNIKLIALNILTSTGEYYSKDYPDQEFSSYLSAFNILLSPTKTNHNVMLGAISPQRDQKYRYYKQAITEYEINYKKSPLGQLDKDALRRKYQLQQKIINSFLSIHKDNPEFNFSQLFALGLISSEMQGLITENPTAKEATEINAVVAEAKQLTRYDSFFTQLLRIAISQQATRNICNNATNIPGELSQLSELRARALNAKNVLQSLNQTIVVNGQGITAHQYLTLNGGKPEYLPFFALVNINHSGNIKQQIDELHNTLANISPQVIEKFITDLTNAQLPYQNGGIRSRTSWPKIDIQELTSHKCDNLFTPYQRDLHPVQEATKYNGISYQITYSLPIKLAEFIKVYAHPTNYKDNGKYRELNQQELISKLINSNYIEEELLPSLGHNRSNPDFIKQASHDLIYCILKTRATREKGWKEHTKLLTDLVFDSNRSLKIQYAEIEANLRNLRTIFNIIRKQHGEPIATQEIHAIVKALSRPPKAEGKALTKIFAFLAEIDPNKLSYKNFTYSQLINSAPASLIKNNFPTFKMATDLLLNLANNRLKPEDLYKLVDNLSVDELNNSIFKKIIKYCQQNKNYTLITVLSSIKVKPEYQTQLVNILTSYDISILQQIQNNPLINLKKLFNEGKIANVKYIIDIALKLGITGDRAVQFIEKLNKQNNDYVQVVASYINEYQAKNSIDYLFEVVLSNNSKSQLKNKLHLIFTQDTSRFDYDETRIIELIRQIKHKRADNESSPLLLIEEKELLRCFKSLMNFMKEQPIVKDKKGNNRAICKLSSLEIQELVRHLKHRRMHLKGHSILEKRMLDLQFTALTLEMLYRNTGKFPRDTQILSILNSMIHHSDMIQEIATGQGKSIITALHASYLWFTGQTVDVVSSNRSLAAHDLAEFSNYYNSLGIEYGPTIITTTSEPKDYKKGGINYSTPSDIALFRANIEFYPESRDASLNHDRSLVCDEVDAALTSELNYRLACSMLDINKDATRELFSNILSFAASPTFMSEHVARKDDVFNLKQYLYYQFQLAKGSLFKWPLKINQVNGLKQSNKVEDRNLYLLYQALHKAELLGEQQEFEFFDTLLDSALEAQRLTEGRDFVLPPKAANDHNAKNLKAIPLIENRPSLGSVFGKGVQGFLHIILESKYPDLKGKFQISPPSATIFNITAKNFFDYYRLTGGRIIGLTGTAGTSSDLKEFRRINKIEAYSHPRFEKDERRKIPSQITANNKAQLDFLTGRLLATYTANQAENDLNKIRPIIIFCTDPQEAIKTFEKLKAILPTTVRNLQLFAASDKDTGSESEVIKSAGSNNSITVTTPMLGRGTDFFTKHPQGFFAYNLCTKITANDLTQMYGRVGRNGMPGEFRSIFNAEEFIDPQQLSELQADDTMKAVAHAKRVQRLRNQPLSDVLIYFNHVFAGNHILACQANEFINKAWKKLLKENNTNTNQEKEGLLALRARLVKVVQEKYKDASSKLEQFLAQIDKDELVEIRLDDNEEISLHLADITSQAITPTYNIPVIDYSYIFEQESVTLEATQRFDKINQELMAIISNANNTDLAKIDALYAECNQIYTKHPELQYDNITKQFKMLSQVLLEQMDAELSSYQIAEKLLRLNNQHVLLPYAKKLAYQILPSPEQAEAKLSAKVTQQPELSQGFLATPSLSYLFAKNYWKDVRKEAGFSAPITLLLDSKDLNTLSIKQKNFYQDVWMVQSAILATHIFTLEHAPLKVTKNIKIKTEGSSPALMVPGLQDSYKSYCHMIKGKNTTKIKRFIENFRDIKDLNINALELGAYQAIMIGTDSDSDSGHAETILTNGKLLFWINRGAGAKTPGIEIFQITQNMDELKKVLNQIQQKNVNKVIYSHEEMQADINNLCKIADQEEQVQPIRIISMKGQKIGNCGWTQSKAVVRAAMIADMLEESDELPDISPAKWQRILQSSNELYKDFTTFNRLQKAEEILLSINDQYQAQYLTQEQQNRIKTLTDFKIIPSLPHKFIKKIAQSLMQEKELSDKFRHNIYSQQAKKIAKFFSCLSDNMVSKITVSEIKSSMIEGKLPKFSNLLRLSKDNLTNEQQKEIFDCFIQLQQSDNNLIKINKLEYVQNLITLLTENYQYTILHYLATMEESFLSEALISTSLASFPAAEPIFITFELANLISQYSATEDNRLAIYNFISNYLSNIYKNEDNTQLVNYKNWLDLLLSNNTNDKINGITGLINSDIAGIYISKIVTKLISPELSFELMIQNRDNVNEKIIRALKNELNNNQSEQLIKELLLNCIKQAENDTSLESIQSIQTLLKLLTTNFEGEVLANLNILLENNIDDNLLKTIITNLSTQDLLIKECLELNNIIGLNRIINLMTSNPLEFNGAEFSKLIAANLPKIIARTKLADNHFVQNAFDLAAENLYKTAMRNNQLNELDAVGESALHRVADSNSSERLRTLLDKQEIEIDIKDKTLGATPLHYAILTKQAKNIKLILDKGANINIADNEGNTPLHWAALYGTPEIMYSLLMRGANLLATNNDNKTPSDLINDVVLKLSLGRMKSLSLDLTYFIKSYDGSFLKKDKLLQDILKKADASPHGTAAEKESYKEFATSFVEEFYNRGDVKKALSNSTGVKNIVIPGLVAGLMATGILLVLTGPLVVPALPIILVTAIAAAGIGGIKMLVKNKNINKEFKAKYSDLLNDKSRGNPDISLGT
ncbi:ankyrin repeat domain-containing protein [Rickettsiales endosymbiont of Stachyamoeba lipophora]|uniref:ankyrin repeat domain-containing protein n=1 Tax=Rickettsiales endosymbiont of Stachyamoeba lipophora TaxID=2486578 RepID=UPI000F64B70F|nr:ankyrin repeat domain-containing protein [Rickettsiales endosymbiont of Stachyamoeba lipophora]AZL16343.1 hypothetical protein EF513_07380 [Rickettsiales endosymbiont of Stachyamoeba lipophora]